MASDRFCLVDVGCDRWDSVTATVRPGVASTGPDRRLPVAAIDLILMFAAPIALAAAVVERFPLDRNRADGPIAAVDQGRIDEIDAGFHRAVEIGDQLYTLSGWGWWGSLFLLVAAALVTVVVVPAMADGRTPGRLALAWFDGRRGRSALHPPATRPGSDDDPAAATIVLADPEPVALVIELDEPAADPTTATTSPGTSTGPTGQSVDAIAEPDRAERDWAEVGWVEIRRPDERPLDDDQTPAADLTDELANDLSDDLADHGPASGGRRAEDGDIDLHVDLDLDLDLDAEREREQEPARPPDPSLGWLGHEEDYRRWTGDIGPPAPPRPPGTGRAAPFDELILPESSLAESARTAVVRRSEPVWDPDHRIWLYEDPTTGLWYRREQESDDWVSLVAEHPG